MDRTSLLDNRRIARVLEIVRTHDGITEVAIGEIMGVAEDRVSRILYLLDLEGLVVTDGIEVADDVTRLLWHATDFEPERGVL